MSIVVEDGTIVTGANSYVTTTELSTYATDRGITILGTTSILVLQAMDYIEAQNFKGYKKTAAQPLVWPREYVYIDGYLFDNDGIPEQLKNGQMAAALAIDAGNSPYAVIERQIESERVDVIEVRYQKGAVANTIDPAINQALRKLLNGSNYGNTFTVSKG